MQSSSQSEIWINGIKSNYLENTITKQTQNKANLYIGNKGGTTDFYTGSISDLMIFNTYKTLNQIKNLSSSIDGSPYIGNIFYSQGIAAITHLKHQNIAKPPSVGTGNNPGFNMEFKSIHPIYENEYLCTVSPHEYNYSHNVSTRKIKSDQQPTLASFTTGSIFKPYITTIGLFDENNELLVIGKLGQPTKVSDETDTTFVIRWDS